MRTPTVMITFSSINQVARGDDNLNEIDTSTDKI